MHFLITAGGTREYVDPVRFISNASSGKMGYALTRAALKRGHRVTLITTIENLKLKTQNSKLMKLVKVETAAEMFRAVKKHFPRCDCLIMAAAVGDYTPAGPATSKIRRENKPLTIKLRPTPDIAKWAGTHKNSKSCQRRFVAGFALEDKNVRQNAERKLKEKNLDMIIANSPAAIGTDKVAIQIKTPGAKWLKFPRARKTVAAGRIISLIGGVKKNENTN